MLVLLLLPKGLAGGAIVVTGRLPLLPRVVFCCWHEVLYGADGGVSSRQGKVPEIFVRK